MHLSPKNALQKLANHNALFLSLFTHGTLQVEIYSPKDEDLQTPHTRDEVYIILAGHGEFLNGETRSTFAPGDFLFVPAGVVHRFENFSADFSTWVLFYGPEGGEKKNASL